MIFLLLDKFAKKFLFEDVLFDVLRGAIRRIFFTFLVLKFHQNWYTTFKLIMLKRVTIPVSRCHVIGPYGWNVISETYLGHLQEAIYYAVSL